MVSGDLAARSIVRSIKRVSVGNVSSLVRHYERACSAEMGDELRDSVLIQRALFSSRRTIGDAIRGANRGSSLTDAILEVAIGTREYRALRRQMFISAPRFSARLAWARARAWFASVPAAADSR